MEGEGVLYLLKSRCVSMVNSKFTHVCHRVISTTL